MTVSDVTITAGGITFTFTSGDLKNCKSTISSNIESNELSGTGPQNSQLFDFNGSGKTIALSGALTNADSTRTTSGTVTTAQQQKFWLESLLNGNQSPMFFTSNLEFQSITSSSGAVSPYQGAFTLTQVMVETIDFTEEEGVDATTFIPFNMTLKVGTF